MLRVILTVVQVFASLAIVTLVLLQRGKGAEAGAGFGAGASGTVFGARGASSTLSRVTAIFAAIFMANSLLLTYMGTRTETPHTILDQAGQHTPAAPASKVPAAPAAGQGVGAVPEVLPVPTGSASATSSAPTVTVPPQAAPAPSASASAASKEPAPPAPK